MMLYWRCCREWKRRGEPLSCCYIAGGIMMLFAHHSRGTLWMECQHPLSRFHPSLLNSHLTFSPSLPIFHTHPPGSTSNSVSQAHAFYLTRAAFQLLFFVSSFALPLPLVPVSHSLFSPLPSGTINGSASSPHPTPPIPLFSLLLGLSRALTTLPTSSDLRFTLLSVITIPSLMYLFASRADAFYLPQAGWIPCLHPSHFSSFSLSFTLLPSPHSFFPRFLDCSLSPFPQAPPSTARLRLPFSSPSSSSAYPAPSQPSPRPPTFDSRSSPSSPSRLSCTSLPPGLTPSTSPKRVSPSLSSSLYSSSPPSGKSSSGGFYSTRILPSPPLLSPPGYTLASLPSSLAPPPPSLLSSPPSRLCAPSRSLGIGLWTRKCFTAFCRRPYTC
ncbi:unnamed protein product [Closterium sp. NIES-53]